MPAVVRPLVVTAHGQAHAFGARFSALRNWSVRAAAPVSWGWPNDFIVQLGSLLERRVEPVDRSQDDSLHLITLHFDGTIEPRADAPIVGIKGRLFHAHPGDVVYSKIDIRHGAAGVVPPEMTGAVVTSEYPVYAVRRGVALPEYIQLLFRTERFRNVVGRMISGASGRKRVQPEQLAIVGVPCPPLSAQLEIVQRWQSAKYSIEEAKRAISDQRAAINAELLRELGLQEQERRIAASVLRAPWRSLGRWSVSWYKASIAALDLSQAAYPIVRLGEVLERLQYGTSTKANSRGLGTPVLRMNNIVDGQLDFTDVKYVELTEREKAGWKLQEGDILLNRTNSKELVGKCAVFRAQNDFVFASYLLRLVVRPTLADSDFVAIVLNSPIGRSQIDAVSRQIIGQANINSSELKNLLVPLPPLKVQQRLARSMTAAQAQIVAIEQHLTSLQSSAQEELETMILGMNVINGQLEGRQ
jgi:type I restriction enzyme S subunit